MSVLDHFDFAEYVERLDPKAPLSNPDQVSISCINPDCDDSWRKGRKMTVNLKQKIAWCYKCQKHYRLVDFVAEVEGLTRFQALKMLENETPKLAPGQNLETVLLDLVSKKADPELPQAAKKPEFPLTIPIVPSSPPWEYLTQRGFDQGVIEHFKLGWCPASPKYGQRIVIPVHDENGELASFQARTLRPEIKPKYLFPPGFEPYLYNWAFAKSYSTVILVEGVTDAWRLWTRGFWNVVATFGKALKPRQKKIINGADWLKKVIFFWDGDAIAEAYKAASDIVPSKEIAIVELPVGQEPDNCPDPSQAILQAINPRTLTPLEKALRASGFK